MGKVQQSKTTKSQKRKTGRSGKSADATPESVSDGVKELAIITEHDIKKSVNMNLDKSDLIAYQVVQIEDKLNKEIAVKKKEIDKLRDEIKKASDAIIVACDALISSTYADKAKAISKSLAVLGIKRSCKLVLTTGDSHHRHHDHRESFDEDNEVPQKDTADHVFAIIKIIKSRDYVDREYNLSPIKKSAEIKKMEEGMSKLETTMKEITNKYTDLQYKVSNIDKMERHAKARFVENLLKSSEAGKTILGVSNANTDK